MELEKKVYVLKENEEFGGFWARFGAYVIDLMPIIIGRTLILYLVGAIFGLKSDWINDLGFKASSLISFLFVWIYHIPFLTADSTTFGKSLFGLRVVDAVTGNKVSFKQAVKRSLAYYISSVFFGIGFLQIAFDKKFKKGLHDIVAKTLVVRDKNKKVSPVVIIFAGLATAGLVLAAFISIRDVWISRVGNNDLNSSLGVRHESIPSSRSEDFWMIDTKGNLLSLNINSGKAEPLTTYPGQGPNSDNVITKPTAGKFVYYKREVKDNKLDWGIYVSDILGKSEKLISKGFICFDGPCYDKDPEYLSIYRLSSDGNFLAYRKGERMAIYDLEKGREEYFPLLQLESVDFSPAWKYMYGTLGSSKLGFVDVEKEKLNSFTLDNISINTISFSDDESLVAVSGRYDISTAGLALIDIKNNRILKQIELRDSLSKYDHVAWVSNKKFVALFKNPKNKFVEVFVFQINGETVSYEKVYEGMDLRNPFRIDEENILLGSGSKDVISLSLKTKEGKVVYTYPGGERDYFFVIGPVDSKSELLIRSHLPTTSSSSGKTTPPQEVAVFTTSTAPGQKWYTLSGPILNSEISITFPAEPGHASFSPGVSDTYMSSGFGSDKQTYSLTFFARNSQSGLTSDQFLDQLVANLASRNTLLSSSSELVSGLPARNFIAKTSKDIFLKGVMVVTEYALYQAQVAYRESEYNEQNYFEFIKSLQILPKLGE